MQNSSGNQEGDLAVVYKDDRQYVTSTTQFNSCTFPAVVVLDQAVLSSYSCDFSNVSGSYFNGTADLDESYFMFSGFDDDENEYMVDYYSEDGITYINNSGRDVVMRFNTTIKCSAPARFSENIGKFMQIGSCEFEGVYKYDYDTSVSPSQLSWSQAPSQLNVIADTVYNGIFYGKNGVETGKLSTVNNLSVTDIETKIMVYSGLSRLELNASVTNLSGLGRRVGASKIYTVPNINTTSVTNMNAMFSQLSNLLYLPPYDTSNVVDMSSAFADCIRITNVPNFNFENTIYMSGTFAGCRNIKEFPNFNTPKVTLMNRTFLSCDISNSPNIVTTNVTDMSTIFYNCLNLVNVQQYDTSNVTNLFEAFYKCNNLSDASIQNIINMCLNSNITNVTLMNLSTSNTYGPFYGTNITSSRYSNRLSDLSAAGWTY